MKFGENFRKIRISNNLTQKQVADLMGIRQSNVSDWEADKSRPEYEHLIELAQIYDVSLEELLGME